MTLILSGTNGLSDVDGDASTPAVRGTDANTGIFFPAADTIAFAEGGAEAMRIDSSGNLNIGTNSSFGGKISILKTPGTAFSDSSIAVTDGSNVTLYMGNTSTTASSIWTSDLLSFGTGADAFTERARITSDGKFLLGNTDGTALITAGSNKLITGNEASGFTAGTSGYWFAGNTSGGSCTMGADFISSAGTAILAGDSATTNGIYFRTYNGGEYEYRFRIAVSGSATNSTGSYGTISDARTKTVVGDASLQWNDIKQLNFVKYKLNKNIEFEQSEENKGGYVAPKMLGLVAQEVEQICPGLIEESADPEFGQVKVIKTSILYMKAVKALQEAMERIETLEASNTALEARIAALETGV
jgi:hypothetical protein